MSPVKCRSMVQLILFIIFLASTLGTVFILYKKIPVLTALPQNGHHGFKKPEFFSNIEKKIRKHHFHFFKKKMLLHKFLSKIRILVLKLERKISELLHGIRKNAQELDKQAKKRK